MRIKGLKITQTCGACPEQYEVFKEDGEQVGYLRLRHGGFTVSYPSCGGDLIYESATKGDGAFEDDERAHYLNQAIEAIIRKMLDTEFGGD